MKRECLKCGDCCENILLPKGDLKIILDVESYDFAIENWFRVPKKRMNRYMIENVWENLVAYSCKQFDTKTRLCKCHKNRPPVCRNYHGGPKESLISERCGLCY